MNIVNAYRFGVNVVFEPEYQAVLDYALNNSINIPETPQNIINNQIILDFKTSGAWSELDVFWLLKQQGVVRDFAKINWVNPNLHYLTEIGNTMSFVSGQGFLANNNGYFNTNYNPRTDNVASSNNNYGLGITCSASFNINSNQLYFGSRDTSSNNFQPDTNGVYLGGSTSNSNLGGGKPDTTNKLYTRLNSNYQSFQDGLNTSNFNVLNSSLPSTRDVYLYAHNPLNRPLGTGYIYYFYIGSSALRNTAQEQSDALDIINTY